MKNNSSYQEYLKHENEITKLKIQAEFGLELNSENELNPAIENIWLNQILDFERSAANGNQVSIREILGNPIFQPFEKMDDYTFNSEFQKLMESLHKNNIVIDSVAGVDEKEMYRFIIEELFEEKINTNLPKNMLTCYIYEEFYPNHEHDIKNRIQELMSALADKKTESFKYYITNFIDDETEEIKTASLKRKLSLFKNAFDDVKLINYEVKNININDVLAEVLVDFNLSVLPAESHTYYEIAGPGKINLTLRYDWWSITGIEMTGVV